MQINGTRILILGGWGLVGSAICHKLLEHNPSKLIVSSLRKHEAENAVEELRKEYKNLDPNIFEARWGNVFTRTEWKDRNWADVVNDANGRKTVIKDIFNELDESIVKNSALYSLITETKPDIVIDCINTATAIAYLDIYKTTLNVIDKSELGTLGNDDVERLMASSYIPQLIRHIQLLNKGLNDAGSNAYFKIGTSGTGGMGMNIPYTHSEERPSRVLLSKTAVAGAQTLLLFLMARTPGGPIVKEIKPTAAIAWKRIAFDEVKHGGKQIRLVDMKVSNALDAQGTLKKVESAGIEKKDDIYRSIFIDTGENGIFSKNEFEAISSIGQMEIVTPEEIATYAVHELNGGNTGYDMIQGLDSFSLGPTYRGGLLRQTAMEKLESLEKEHKIDSVAFELLGPPRLSKLLFEANIIKKIAGSVRKAMELKPEHLSSEALRIITEDDRLRSEMLSIGLVIMLPDGKKYLRGETIKIPSFRKEEELELSKDNIDKWCYEAWVDLRPENFEIWQDRFSNIIKQAEAVPDGETSSRYVYTRSYWNNFETVYEGKIAGWIFEYEDDGYRFKR